MGRPKGSKNVFSTRIKHICKLCGVEFTSAAHRINAKFCCHEHYARNLVYGKHSKKHKNNISNSLKGKYVAKNSHRWKGGKRKDNRGYIFIYSFEHPFKNTSNYVYEHRLIMEKHLGRYLMKGEIVHHINKIRDDNRIENLMLFPNIGAHTAFHGEMKKNKIIH